MASNPSQYLPEPAPIADKNGLVSRTWLMAFFQPVAKLLVTVGNVFGPSGGSVDSQIALFDSTTGKLLKAATGTGVVHATSGVYSAADVSLAEIVPATAASRLLGRRSSGAGDFEEVSLGSGLAMSAGAVLSATGSGGTVTSVTGTAPIASTGGTTPAISLNDTAVTPGSYTSADITVDAKGRITAAASGSGGGGGLVLLEQQTVAAVAQVDLVSWYSASYDAYLIHLIGVVPATDAELRFRVSTDGGATFEVTNYNIAFQYVVANSGGTGTVGGPNAYMHFATQEATAGVLNASISMWAPGGSTAKLFDYSATMLDNTAVYLLLKGVGVWTPTTAINGLRFYFQGVNIASAIVRIYGYET